MKSLNIYFKPTETVTNEYVNRIREIINVLKQKK